MNSRCFTALDRAVSHVNMAIYALAAVHTEAAKANDQPTAQLALAQAQCLAGILEPLENYWRAISIRLSAPNECGKTKWLEYVDEIRK